MKKVKLCLKTGVTFLIASVLLLQPCITISAFAATDTQPPTIPRGLTASNITYTSILLNWTAASDNTGIKGYQVYRDGKKITTTKKTTYTNVDLVPGRKYTYSIRAYDAAGNVSGDSATVNVATKNDTQAPSTPGALAVSSTAHTAIALTWNSSTDNTSIKGYEIYRSGRKVAATSGTCYTCKGLTPGTTYTFFVKAYDIAGNYSLQSNSISAATVSDNTAPSVPGGLKTSSITETEANLAWSPSSDNVKVKGYEIFRDGSKIGTTSKTSYCSKSLTPGKNYTYIIKAVDTSGNVSGNSIPLKITTQRDLDAPTAPTGLKVNSVKGSSVSLTWNASTDNIKVKGYQILRNGFIIATATRNHCTVKSSSGLGFDVYCVKAYDLSDNLSDSSNKVTVIKLK